MALVTNSLSLIAWYMVEAMVWGGLGNGQSQKLGDPQPEHIVKSHDPLLWIASDAFLTMFCIIIEINSVSDILGVQFFKYKSIN
ncbi:hypothetical protein MY10362_009159 [Beauveria mimosiformis]